LSVEEAVAAHFARCDTKGLSQFKVKRGESIAAFTHEQSRTDYTVLAGQAYPDTHAIRSQQFLRRDLEGRGPNVTEHQPALRRYPIRPGFQHFFNLTLSKNHTPLEGLNYLSLGNLEEPTPHPIEDGDGDDHKEQLDSRTSGNFSRSRHGYILTHVGFRSLVPDKMGVHLAGKRAICGSVWAI
jgi:hypothetical protein